MKKRIGLVVLAALSVIAFGALSAASASAIEPYTAYTCVAATPTNHGTTETWEDSHCTTTQKEGKFAHVAIPAGETTQLTVTAVGTPTQLSATIAGAPVVLEATEGVECIGCHFNNVAGGSVVAKGGHLHYKGVTLAGVASCKVEKGEINTEPLEVVVQSMETGAMGKWTAEVKPEAGTTEAVIHLEPTAGHKSCTLGTSITVKGHADGTANGATAKFATGKGELEIGENVATLTGELTLSGGPTEGEHHAVALTTGV